jgi:hypothetical protein
MKVRLPLLGLILPRRLNAWLVGSAASAVFHLLSGGGRSESRCGSIATLRREGTNPLGAFRADTPPSSRILYGFQGLNRPRAQGLSRSPSRIRHLLGAYKLRKAEHEMAESLGAEVRS